MRDLQDIYDHAYQLGRDGMTGEETIELLQTLYSDRLTEEDLAINGIINAHHTVGMMIFDERN